MDAETVIYQVQFMDHGGRVYATEMLFAEDDVTAIAKAAKIFRMGIGAGYEIWRNGRLVHRAKFGP